jgi:hypothetical protein
MSNLIPLIGVSQIDTNQIATISALNALKFYEIMSNHYGTLTPNAPLLKVASTRPFQFEADMGGSHSITDVAATNESVFSIQKNGSQFATLSFEPGSLVGVFSGVATNFVVGDVLSIMPPATLDSTLFSVWTTLVGVLS